MRSKPPRFAADVPAVHEPKPFRVLERGGRGRAVLRAQRGHRPGGARSRWGLHRNRDDGLKQSASALRMGSAPRVTVQLQDALCPAPTAALFTVCKRTSRFANEPHGLQTNLTVCKRTTIRNGLRRPLDGLSTAGNWRSRRPIRPCGSHSERAGRDRMTTRTADAWIAHWRAGMRWRRRVELELAEQHLLYGDPRDLGELRLGARAHVGVVLDGRCRVGSACVIVSAVVGRQVVRGRGPPVCRRDALGPSWCRPAPRQDEPIRHGRHPQLVAHSSLLSARTTCRRCGRGS